MAEKKDGWGYTYPVVEELGDLSKPNARGEQKRVCICNLMGELRLDIRRWGNDNIMFKGISLNAGEVRRLRKILNSTDFGNL